jgi:hypothetical protein
MPPIDDQGPSYEVGFGKPPKQTRYRKGISGNPKGRPRGRPNWRTLLERAMNEKVVINENGVRKMVTKLEAAFKQLVNKAASGDLRALQQLTPLANTVEQTADVSTKSISEEDAKVFQGFLDRLPKTVTGDDDENK